MMFARSFVLLVVVATAARADVRLPRVFGDHMVIQRDAAVAVWGWADAGEEVTVSIAGKSASGKAGADGKWMVRLERLDAGGPHVLAVKGRNTVELKDVLVGEVWLCSGQSNMAMTVARSNNPSQEAAAANHPNIRMFTVGRTPNRAPQADCTGSWAVCSPATVGDFSAAAYFFGRRIHGDLKVPVGLINSSVGGTDICAWTSRDAQEGVAEIKPVLDRWAADAANWTPEKGQVDYEMKLAVYKTAAAKAKQAKSKAPRAPDKPVNPLDDRNAPATLFNGMIAPLVPFTVRGVLWYQGEHNAGPVEGALRYRTQLPLLIKNWRSLWGAELPFAWVQLPNFGRPGDGWPLVREAMLRTLSVPKTGMAITIDIGETGDVHPKNKQDVGTRLALWALADVYGQSVPAASGPLPAGHEIRGSDVILSFKHAQGLASRGGPLAGFVIAGDDRKWKPATARIEDGKVIVSSSEVAKPAAVRYAWAPDPTCNLVNGAGLPASPFRTDDWPFAK